MARYSTAIVSQTAQLSGVNATTTVNGYMGYLGAASGAGFRLRRVIAHTMTSSAIVPTSQQISIGLYRQTVAPSGTGIAATKAGVALETWTPTDPTAGLFAITATSIGTTGPTLGASEIAVCGMNSQSYEDAVWEGYEEIVCGTGTANGIAFVNIGNTLPTGHFLRFTVEWEV